MNSNINAEKHTQLYEKFITEYKDFFDSDGATSIPSGNQDTNYFLKLQKKRLQNLDVNLEYDIQKRGSLAPGFGEHVSGLTTTDTKYTTTIAYRILQKKTKVTNAQGAVIHKSDEGELCYAAITDLNNPTDIEDESYSCSNCGAVTTIRELLTGCPYCGTRYEMDDLYPTVTGYYFLPDSVNISPKHDIKLKSFLPSILWGVFVALATILFMIFTFNDQTETAIGAFTVSLFMAPILGIIAAATSIPVFYVLKMIIKAIRVLPVWSATSGSKQSLYNAVHPHDPLFSRSVFEMQLNNMVQTLLFTDVWNDLTIYVGNQVNENHKNILDVTSRGVYQFIRSTVEGEDLTLKLGVYLTVTRLTDRNTVTKQDEEYVIVIRRPLSCTTDFSYSIRKVCCKSCASSFDATHNRYCPSCGSIYDAKDDWVVAEFTRRK